MTVQYFDSFLHEIFFRLFELTCHFWRWRVKQIKADLFSDILQIHSIGDDDNENTDERSSQKTVEE